MHQRSLESRRGLSWTMVTKNNVCSLCYVNEHMEWNVLLRKTGTWISYWSQRKVYTAGLPWSGTANIYLLYLCKLSIALLPRSLAPLSHPLMVTSGTSPELLLYYETPTLICRDCLQICPTFGHPKKCISLGKLILPQPILLHSPSADPSRLLLFIQLAPHF